MSRTSDTATVAVIGTGSAGRHHLEALRATPGVRSIAVPIRRSREAELVAEGYVAAGGIEEAAEAGATRVIVATDTARHLSDALAGIDAGCDVLVEKPLARDAIEAGKLVPAAAKAGRKLYVGCILRFSDSLGTFRSMLEDLGALHAVRIECRSYLPAWRTDRPYRESYSADANEGGVLRDLIHEVDYAGWIFGWPASVEGRLRNLGRLGIEAEEAADLAWETPAGCRVTIGLDYLSRPARRRMQAFGEGGTLEWDGISRTVRLDNESGRCREVVSSESPEARFRKQAEAFLGMGDEEAATGLDGWRALAVCDAARKSSETGRAEAVEYP